MEIIKEEIKNFDKERLELMKEIVFLYKEFGKQCSIWDTYSYPQEDSAFVVHENTIDKQWEFVCKINDCDVNDIDSSVYKDEFTLFNLRETRDEFLDDVNYIKACNENMKDK